jgi:hypothetical protein
MVDEFIIYDCVQYSKNDWRNRNQIKTPEGLQWLTIPVSTPNGLKTRIDEVLCSDPNWPKKHWNAIVCNYSRAKYFDQYKDGLSDLYGGIQTNNLSQINLRFLNYVCKVLSIKTRISSATSYELCQDRNLRLVSLCKQLGASVYLSGPAAKSYIDADLFSEHQIKIEWMDYSGYPEYRQLFPPFEHAVSILDLILNEGQEATRYMRSFDKAREKSRI